MSVKEPPVKRIKINDAIEVVMGRTPKSWENKSATSKRECVDILCEELKGWLIDCVIPAIIKMLKESKRQKYRSLSLILKDSYSNLGNVAAVLAKIRKPAKNVEQLSPFQGLTMLLDANLSKSQYLKVRESALLCGSPVFPSYDSVRIAKDQCRPPLKYAAISKTSAFYTLAILAKFTASRIVTMQKDVILQNQRKHKIKSEVCTIIFSCGFDGSSGQSNFKQKYSNNAKASANDDSSIFATTLVPLRLQNSSGSIYWNNRTPQSVRFCRPLKIQFAKETQQLIKDEKQSLDEQIKKLADMTIKFDDSHLITLKFQFYIFMIDGKVLSVITGTKSSQSCAICGCLPNDFNVSKNLDSGKFKAKPENLAYGISPLHAYIRCMEWMLHVSYKLGIKTWQARGEKDKENVKTRKKLIQKTLWDKMGLRVDFPNSSGSGTSNDGNSARRAFHNCDEFASILGIRADIVRMVRNILLALNSQLPINATSYKSYCRELYIKYLEDYEWYKLPASVHKILVHGSEIVTATSLPLGMIGEEGAEARNKLYKSDRQFHARKISRYNTMFDMYFRAIDSSDPIMSIQSLRSRINSKSRKEHVEPQASGRQTPRVDDLCFDVTVAEVLDEIVLDNECELNEYELDEN